MAGFLSGGKQEENKKPRQVVLARLGKELKLNRALAPGQRSG